MQYGVMGFDNVWHDWSATPGLRIVAPWAVLS